VKKRTLIALSLLMATPLIAKNIESEGNLKSDTPVGLKEIKRITNQHNPVDLFQFVRSQVEQKKYDEAAVAYFVAMAYGMYDTQRVEDVSAHQAIIVLRMNTVDGFSEEQLESLQTEIGKLLENEKSILDVLNKIGKPKYHPKYMIQHGMGAFTGNKSKDGLIPDFDSDTAWKEILSSVSE